MLGVLRRVVLGIALAPLHLRHFGFQDETKFHNKELHDPAGTKCPAILKRSLFGLVHVYNRLSQRTVNAISVQQFQRNLLCIAKNEVDTNPNWDWIFRRM